MKKFAIAFAGLAMVATTAPAAMAAAPQPGYHQDWQSINGRQARLEARINQGIRSHALTYREAAALRVEFRSLERLEAQYRRSRPGLTLAERRDLDRRYDRLEAKVRIQKNDRQDRRGHRGR